MMELTDRDAALERMKSMAGCATCDNYNYVRCRACSWDDAMNIVEEMSEVDAVPVVHAQWVDIPDRPQWDQKMCSACGDYFCCQNTFCPNCGAKMDGERSGDDGKAD